MFSTQLTAALAEAPEGADQLSAPRKLSKKAVSYNIISKPSVKKEKHTSSSSKNLSASEKISKKFTTHESGLARTVVLTRPDGKKVVRIPKIKGRVIVYVIQGCPDCRKVKHILLKQLQLPVREINLTAYPEKTDELIALSKSSDIPQIFFNNKHIGTYSDIKEKIESGTLEPLIEWVRNTPYEDLPNSPSLPEVERLPQLSCALDPDFRIITLLREKGTRIRLRSHFEGIHRFKKTFTGSTLVEWILKYQDKITKENKAISISSREDAINYATTLMDKQFFHHVLYKDGFHADKSLYRFFLDDEITAENVVPGEISQCLPISDLNEFSVHLRSSFACLLDKFLTKTPARLGSCSSLSSSHKPSTINPKYSMQAVNINVLSESEEWGNIRFLISQLARINLKSLYGDLNSPRGITKAKSASSLEKMPVVDEKDEEGETDQTVISNENKLKMDREVKCFWLNVYNMLALDLFVRRGYPNSGWQRQQFFGTYKYLINGMLFSLEEISNGILRSNRQGTFSLGKPFDLGDPRIKYVLDACEPRAHFALARGSKHMGDIQLYFPDTIDAQLDANVKSFFASSCGFKFGHRRKIYVSELVKWYYSDFGRDDIEVASWMARYLPGVDQAQLEEMLAKDTRRRKVKLSWISWDWAPMIML